MPRVSRKSLAPPIPKDKNRFESKHATPLHRISQHRYKSEFEPQQCTDGMFKLLSTTPPATSFYADGDIDIRDVDKNNQTSTELVSIKTKNTFSDNGPKGMKKEIHIEVPKLIEYFLSFIQH